MPLLAQVVLALAAAPPSEDSPVPCAYGPSREYLTLSDAHAAHFASKDAYDAYDGVGLGNEMGLLGIKVLPRANASLLRSLLPAGQVMVSECAAQEAPGRTWHRQRVGPFRTTGGYNFVQLGWRDAGGLGIEHMPMAIIGHKIAVVDLDGHDLSLPPIHHHHCHVAPGLGYSFESTVQTRDACLLDGTSCPDYSAIIFHHGDYECPAASGGVACFNERYDAHPRWALEPLSLNAEINDVRRLGSTPIIWYLMISLLVRDQRSSGGRPTPAADDDAPMSVHQVINPGLKELDKQAGLLTLVHCPSASDSFFYYTGRMPFGGKFLPELVRFHSHAVAMQETLLFDALPHALGLEEAPFRPPAAWKAVVTESTGLADNTALRARVIERARASGGRVLCTAVSRLEVVDGMAYDRMPRIQCAEWRFARGDAWTTLALNGPHSKAFFQDPLTIEHLAGDEYYKHPAHGDRVAKMEGMAQSQHDDPFDFRQHVQWHLSYLAEDGGSHWTFATHSQTPDASAPRNNRVTLVRLILHRGTFQTGVGPIERTRVALFLAARVSGRHPLASVLLAVLLCALPARLCMQQRPAAAVLVLAAEAYAAVFAVYMSLPPVLLPNPHDALLMLEHEDEHLRATVQVAAVVLVLLVLAMAPCATRELRKDGMIAAVLPAAFCSFADFFGLSALVPLIPFHLLAEGDGCSEAAVASWAGAINSLQYVGVVLGCIFWGVVSDRFGAMRALRITMVGDVIFFAASGAVTGAETLCLVRVLAGFFSPLVPAAAYIFAVTDAKDAVRATGLNAMGIAVGYALGTSCIGLYPSIGWVGVASLGAAVASAALCSTLPCWACNATAAAALPAAPRPDVRGVRGAMVSGTFLTQAASAFALMFYFVGAMSILVIDLMERFRFSPHQVALVYVCAPIGYALSILIAPRLTDVFGLQPIVTGGHLVIASSCAALATPAINSSLSALLLLWVVATLGMSFAILPAQARAKLVGVHQTRNGTGSITGTSRVIQTCGQAAAPIVATTLYVHLGPWAPWAAFGAVQLGAVALYPTLGVTLRHDPDWTRVAASASAAMADEALPGTIRARPPPPPRLRARTAIALLFLCGVIDMNDRMSFSLYAHVVQQDAALSDAQLAVVLSSVTSLASLLFSLPMGRAADKVRGAPLLAALLLALAVCELLNFTSLTSAFVPLAMLRFAASVADVSIPVILVPLACRLSTPTELPIALSLITTSYAIGGALSNVAAPLIGGAEGWRPALIWLVAVPGVAVALALLRLLPDTTKPEAASAMDFSVRSFGSLVYRLGVTLPALCLLYQLELCQLVWYPAYFSRYGGRSVGEIGVLMSASLALQFAGSLCGASMASCLGRGPRVYLALCVLAAFMTGALFNVLLAVDAASISATCLVLSIGFTLGLRSGPSYAIISRRAGADTGVAAALVVIGNNLAALAVGPTLVGLLSQWWAGADSLRRALQVVVTTCSGLAAALWLWTILRRSDLAEAAEPSNSAQKHKYSVIGRNDLAEAAEPSCQLTPST